MTSMTDIDRTRYADSDALVEPHRGLIRRIGWKGAGGDRDPMPT